MTEGVTSSAILKTELPWTGAFYFRPARAVDGGVSEKRAVCAGNKIMHEISDTAADPAYNWVRPDDKTDWFYKNGNPARFKVIDPATGAVPVRNGVPITVIVEPAGEEIITGFPE